MAASTSQASELIFSRMSRNVPHYKSLEIMKEVSSASGKGAKAIQMRIKKPFYKRSHIPFGIAIKVSINNLRNMPKFRPHSMLDNTFVNHFVSESAHHYDKIKHQMTYQYYQAQTTRETMQNIERPIYFMKYLFISAGVIDTKHESFYRHALFASS